MTFLCLLAGCQIQSDLKALYNQYKDMKKPRPVILNYPNYKPNAAWKYGQELYDIWNKYQSEKWNSFVQSLLKEVID